MAWISQGFSPADIPGLFRWYDASDAATITSAGSPARVSSWADKAGSGSPLAQATGGQQPKTGANTQNGLNIFEFDETRPDFLAGSFSVSANSVSVFATANKVGNAGAAANYSRIVSMWNTANAPGSPGDFGSTNSWASIIYNQPALAGFAPGVTSYRASTGITGQALSYATWNTTCAVLDGSTGYLYHNGVQTSGATSATAISVNQLRVGAAPVSSGGDSNLNGPIGEVIIYSGVTLTSPQILQVIAYLKAKWATA